MNDLKHFFQLYYSVSIKYSLNNVLNHIDLNYKLLLKTSGGQNYELTPLHNIEELDMSYLEIILKNILTFRAGYITL